MTGHHDHDEDDALRGFDLDAWAPPAPPPAGALADAVVARMRMEQPGHAEPGEPGDLGERPRRRRALIRALAGAAVVAVAAAGVLAIGRWGATRAPEAGRGEVFAARASHVELGASSSAELDPGAEVRWQRERRRISAAQPRGAALWRVDGDDTLVIDAGAAVASVEASGASLRVEVQMNRTDARVIGASAVTAVAVALITVVVYQGQVKVTSAGQTVNVESGGAVEIRPQQPARHELTVGAAAPDVEKMQEELRELREQLEAAKKALAEKTPPTCDAEALDERGRELFAAGQFADALAAFQRALACKTDPRVELRAFLAACNLKSIPPAVRHYAMLSPALRAQSLAVCVRNGITEEALVGRPPTPKVCDANELSDRGRDAFSAGQLAAALGFYEQAIACRPDPNFLQKAFVVACNARNIAKAASFWGRMPQALRIQAVNICVRNGITEEDLTAAAEALGTLAITSSPPAKISIDGREVGTSPVTVEVPPGRHRVTFAVGSDKYTFTVVAKAGETVTLNKVLSNP